MSEFSTSGSVHIEVDQGSLREAKDDIEGELGSVQVEVNALPNSGRFQDRIQRAADNADVSVAPDVDEDSMGSISLDAEQAAPDGGVTGMGADAATIDELNEQTDLLEDIYDEVDDMAGAGGGGGGGGGEGGGGGLGGVATGFGLRGLLGGAGLGMAGATGGAVLGGGIIIDQVGKAFGDLTSEDFSNMLFGQAGGMVPEGFWDDQAGDGIAFHDATLALGSATIQGLEDVITTDEGDDQPEDIVTEDRGPGPDTDTDTTRKSQTGRQDNGRGVPNYKGPAIWGWERISTPNYTPDSTILGEGKQQIGGAETPTGMFGGPTGRRPGGTHGGRARDLAFNERLYTDVMGAGSNRTRPGLGSGGRTAGPGAEINAPVQVDVRTETPSADTVASQVTRQVKPEIKRELQRWLKRDGATNISDEQQSNYQEGF